jgi:hypothetical protein
MLKTVLLLIGTLIVLAGLIYWQMFANPATIVEGLIEDVGSEALKTEVIASDVSFDLITGKARIIRLVISNPDGYSKGVLFETTNIEVEIDPESLDKDVLVLNNVHIRKPKIYFEGDTNGKSNIKTLLDNIGRRSSGSGNASQGEAPKMIINNFLLDSAEIIAFTETDSDKPMVVSVPKVNMTGIGKAKGGVTADVVAKEITRELMSTVISAARKAGIKKTVEEKEKSFLDSLKG